MFSSSSSSDEDLILLDSTLSKYLICKSRRFRVHPLNKKRQQYGEFHHLYSDLRRDPERFVGYMRMKPITFDYIMQKTGDKLVKKWKNFHSQPICVAERLMLTIRFLSTGASFRSLAFSFRMGKSTVANIVSEVVKIIWNTLQCDHMTEPSTEDLKQIAKDYEEIWNFPHCIGSLDGKHIRICCPSHSGSMFFNYKNFFSIVLQGLVDANYKFINIDVGGYGKQSDGGTFKASPLYNKLTNGTLNLPEEEPFPGKRSAMPYVIIADEAYPLMKNLLKPYSKKNLDKDEQYFNNRLSRARRTVECAFGILTAKWEILQKPMTTDVKVVDDIVKCLCVIHNTIIDMEGMDHNLTNTDMRYRPANVPRGRPTAEAKQIRNAFKKYVCENPLHGD